MTLPVGCAAPPGGLDLDTLPDAVAARATVVQGTVTAYGEPLARAYVRLVDPDGEFVAEMPTGPDGGFRFFAAPGPWELRVLAPGRPVRSHPVELELGARETLSLAV
ncbi:DUF1416 domain-containing protein [Nocardioides marmoribigeumensis]|uniref:DUF1416 domain-containing protein n=1 Tax=Nocardioides marmoribigeumensis TaxID=433649 RepID=A0ABU2BWR1_9ACTN|nr:DUF1416 domain-containing protein [Nocardioides marmoribigeumensis]MDR7362029.1 hypothetical protein [Nocardioides marmoribigeumensis]